MSDQNSVPSALPEPSGAGGSAAGRAYREELARTGRVLEPQQGPDEPTTPASRAPDSTEARVAVRKKVNGRARVVLPGTHVDYGQAKFIDISRTGACVLIADPFPIKRPCILECDVFQEGKHYVFSAPAVSIYGILVSGKGYKVGFQFGTLSPSAAKAVDALVA